MKCPCCGSELKNGVLKSSYPIFFVPDESRPEKEPMPVTANGFLKGMLAGCTAPSHFCPQCRMIFTSVD